MVLQTSRMYFGKSSVLLCLVMGTWDSEFKVCMLTYHCSECLRLRSYKQLHQHNQLKISFYFPKHQIPHMLKSTTQCQVLYHKIRPVALIICITDTQYVPNYRPN